MLKALPKEMSSSCAMYLMRTRRSLFTVAPTRAVLLSVTDIRGLPALSLSFRFSRPFSNSEHHHLTLLKARHLSPYVDCIPLWILMGVRSLLHKKRITLHCSYTVDVLSTPAILNALTAALLLAATGNSI